MTFEELSEAIYEDLNGQIATVARDRERYSVFVECDDWQQHDRRRRFELLFEEVQESTATPSCLSSLQSASDHPLLWNHNDEHLTMYFSSVPASPLELLGQLYEAHSLLLGVWRPLSDYLHAGSALMQQGYGQFAQGPRRVIEEYVHVVGDQCRYSIIHGHTPKGGYRIVLLDECYVVCRRVSVVEHADGHTG